MNVLFEMLQELLKKTYEKYSHGEIVDRKDLTKEAKSMYKKWKSQRGDILVPFSAQTLKQKAVHKSNNGEYEFVYNFPNGDNYEEFINPTEVLSISIGTQIDRLGSENGKYAAPIKPDGNVYSIAERSLPYLFLEDYITDEPSYHKYVVQKEINKNALIAAIMSADFSKLDYDEDERKYLLFSVKKGKLLYGHVTPVICFAHQGLGHGMQYRFPISIGYLKALGFLRG